MAARKLWGTGRDGERHEVRRDEGFNVRACRRHEQRIWPGTCRAPGEGLSWTSLLRPKVPKHLQRLLYHCLACAGGGEAVPAGPELVAALE